MQETIRRLIFLTVALHLVLLLFGIIHTSVGCWGLVMQVLYLKCLNDLSEMRIRTAIFIATCGTF
jgi:hypothetical protein